MYPGAGGYSHIAKCFVKVFLECFVEAFKGGGCWGEFVSESDGTGEEGMEMGVDLGRRDMVDERFLRFVGMGKVTRCYWSEGPGKANQKAYKC